MFNYSEVGVLQRGWVTLSANFRWKGTSPTNVFWYQKTRVITLSCGVKISAVCSFVLLQSTRVTDGQTDRQNYDPQLASIAASRGKNGRFTTVSSQVFEGMCLSHSGMVVPACCKDDYQSQWENLTFDRSPYKNGWTGHHSTLHGNPTITLLLYENCFILTSVVLSQTDRQTDDIAVFIMTTAEHCMHLQRSAENQ